MATGLEDLITKIRLGSTMLAMKNSRTTVARCEAKFEPSHERLHEDATVPMDPENCRRGCGITTANESTTSNLSLPKNVLVAGRTATTTKAVLDFARIAPRQPDADGSSLPTDHHVTCLTWNAGFAIA